MKMPRFAARVRAIPFGLVTVVALVVISALRSIEPIRDAATFEPVTEAALGRPLPYIMLAPVSNVLDTMTLLSARQHVVLLLTIVICYAAWWWRRGRYRGAVMTQSRRALREFARIGVALVMVVGIYSAMAIMPRPMAKLEAAPDILVVDFHAHTKYSHDGRPDWTAEDVRAWHRDAGFDVAYITDHRTFEGARDAWANDPVRAGEGTTLLPGIEVVWRGEHVNVLDADRMYKGLLTESLGDIDEQALAMTSTIPGNEPLLIETLPGNLSKIVAAPPGAAGPGVRAIELIDGSPRGLGQGRSEHALIVHLADSLDLALVAGSDNHGWGRTAAGWTLMSIPMFRAAAPEQLSTVIPRVLRGGRRTSTRVVERYVANTESGIRLPLTVPIVAWVMMRTLSPDERVAWIVWAVAIYLLWRLLPIARARATLVA